MSKCIRRQLLRYFVGTPLALLLCCGTTSFSEVARDAAEAAGACGPGLLTDGARVINAAHTGGADWGQILTLVFAGLGDAKCIAEQVRSHLRDHHEVVAGPVTVVRIPKGERRRLRCLLGLAKWTDDDTTSLRDDWLRHESMEDL